MALMWDDRLIGWLVFMRLQRELVAIPDIVRVAMAKKGWIEGSVDPLQEGDFFDVCLTDEGAKVADLYAGDWGVDGLGFMEERSFD